MSQYISFDSQTGELKIKCQSGASSIYGVNGCGFSEIVGFLMDQIVKANNNAHSHLNIIALRHLDHARACLDDRSEDREQRGVKGKVEI